MPDLGLLHDSHPGPIGRWPATLVKSKMRAAASREWSRRRSNRRSLSGGKRANRVDDLGSAGADEPIAATVRCLERARSQFGL